MTSYGSGLDPLQELVRRFSLMEGCTPDQDEQRYPPLKKLSDIFAVKETEGHIFIYPTSTFEHKVITINIILDVPDFNAGLE